MALISACLDPSASSNDDATVARMLEYHNGDYDSGMDVDERLLSKTNEFEEDTMHPVSGSLARTHSLILDNLHRISDK